jgi:putative copper export protein
MTGWEIVRFLHLLAMAFFVGGQLVLVAAVVPVMRGEENRDQMRAMARKFGIGSAVAFAVLIVTGSMMAGHYDLWSDWKLQLKLGLVLLTIILIGWHTRRPQQHWLEGVVFLLSLAIVWLGVSLAH